ncbi:hypothetical protein AAFF_G00165240 [Aldrovandia affinis]|uniref:Uncharacterized protein n=1 Tax=Aldrovandia affinis TaxID=143900 RepID=A0AAD7RMN8_9TELE|nr:hypothetical protein AAFF_G00165240 [Aldrovandia affinis]
MPSLSAPTPGCVKFSCGSERVTFKPGGRRTRFLRKMGRAAPTRSAGPARARTNQQPATLPTARKGTFTDDLHKLVDNWARDAMNLSQGKRGPKQAPPPASQSHTYDVRTRSAGQPSACQDPVRIWLSLCYGGGGDPYTPLTL